MKRSILISVSALAVILSLGSCKPKQSAYRQVYEQAKQREIAQQQANPSAAQNTGTVIVSKPAQSDVSVRRERLETLEGEDASRLSTYSVVIGSFQNHSNAYSLKERMENEGYTPVLAKNAQGMLRVIVASYNTRAEAEEGRDAFVERHSQFSDAWLLERER